ncbi:hypothetical protein HCN44_002883 [Aphidius gifuensis]|uniref:Uncharacterized protein n=1 Tax=Aphidius gifuensis TaxID=684658 RepID=A0A834XV31_APHGI|nr:uncharacterized protein LOC122854275 [Aphidius gifuensis]KAF7991321.1 hypothetical protein HCN44_002883 [Aphidius gifuensis]
MSSINDAILSNISCKCAENHQKRFESTKLDVTDSEPSTPLYKPKPKLEFSQEYIEYKKTLAPQMQNHFLYLMEVRKIQQTREITCYERNELWEKYIRQPELSDDVSDSSPQDDPTPSELYLRTVRT